MVEIRKWVMTWFNFFSIELFKFAEFSKTVVYVNDVTDNDMCKACKYTQVQV